MNDKMSQNNLVLSHSAAAPDQLPTDPQMELDHQQRKGSLCATLDHSNYDIPPTCEVCSQRCPCPGNVCSHVASTGLRPYPENATQSVGKGRSTSGPTPGAELAKDPSLVYDHVGPATILDQLNITIKQQHFFLEEFRKNSGKNCMDAVSR